MTRLSSAEVNEIAGDWLARQDSGEMPSDARAELEGWLAADDRHMGAYLRLRAASRRLDRLAALKSEQAASPAPPAAEPKRPLISRRLAAGLAIAAVLAGGSGLLAAAQPRSYQTDVGEMRRVNLHDGSIVELNTGTAIKIAYSTNRRDIWLRRGEGNFIVAKDKLRPFVVHVGDATFTAVGTAFSVRADGTGPVMLTVSEGVVSLKPEVPAKPQFVAALQQASIGPKADARVESLSYVEVGRRLAWTDGRIALAGQTLGEAAAEFNRYNDRKLVVASGVASARVGGVFRTSEVETFARTAAASLGLDVTERPGGDLVIDLSANVS